MRAGLTASLLAAGLLAAAPAAAATAVSLPGSFNSEIGCPGDWMPDCPAAQLTKGADGLWYADFLIPAGAWSYRVAYDNAWTENYGVGGTGAGADFALAIGVSATVYFRHDDTTHLTEAQFTAFPRPSGGGIPEPQAWALLVGGLVLCGTALRTRRGAVQPC